ncbi:MAG: glycosyltransferase family 2 protein [Sulfolobales archaeon]
MLEILLIVTSLMSNSFIGFLMLYALIITFVGKGNLLTNSSYEALGELPEVSVIIPVRDEFNVLKESLNRLMVVNYPSNKLKVYVGVDKNCVKCLEVCKEFAPKVVPVIVSSKSKPAVLNELLRIVDSDYVLLLDCDSIITSNSIADLVNTIIRYDVCGVTGVPRPSNQCSGILPKFFLVESILWQRLMVGKDYLRLIVQAPGYFTLLKRSCIELIGYWDEESLAEDNDLTLRIYALGSRVKLISSEVYIESPTKLRVLIKQRIRWYRGTLEVLRRRWRVLNKMRPWLKLDAFVTFISPISPTLLLIAVLSNTLLGGIYNLITIALIIPQLITPLLVGEGLDLNARARITLLTLPYVLVNSIASLIAILTLLANVKIGWWRTEKYGRTTTCKNTPTA